jgi:hypothetical protein
MIRNNKRTLWTIATLSAAAGMAHADILYDTLPEIVPSVGGGALPGNTASYRALPSFIGGSGVFGASLDMQTADDFTLAQAFFINRLTIDMNSNPLTANLPEMVMVEFFSDVGGRPDGTAQYALSVGSDRLTRESGFTNPGPATGGFRLGIDLAGLGIELDAGNWWFSVVGVADDHAYTVLRRNDQTTGAAIHFRNGGLAHGNGYSLGPFGSYEWAPYGNLGSNFGLHGDLNARIEGTLVPAPGIAGMLGAIGLGTVSRRRR